MARRGQHVARAGLQNMLHPAAMPDGPRIFLTEPYDPNKITVLMIPGLQSTPFAFVDLLKAMRRDPEVSKHFQVWTFLYATGTPVLFNALELRQQLEKTISAVDPADHDFATRHIVVLGHSMGGLIARTLVSSSGERLWNALFVVPPQRLNGDKATIRRLVDVLHFHRNSRVVAAIFAATPQRGSATGRELDRSPCCLAHSSTIGTAIRHCERGIGESRCCDSDSPSIPPRHEFLLSAHPVATRSGGASDG